MAVVEVLADVVAATDDRPGERAAGVGARAVGRCRRHRRRSADSSSACRLGGSASGRLGIALPLAPGTTSTWPTTRFGSSSPLVARMSVLLTSYFAARASSVSVAATVTMRPVTGGMRSVWPILSLLGLEVVRPPDGHHRDAELVGDPDERVAGLDLVGPTRSLPSGTVVSTATGLTSVPSSRNGPSTSTGSDLGRRRRRRVHGREVVAGVSAVGSGLRIRRRRRDRRSRPCRPCRPRCRACRRRSLDRHRRGRRRCRRRPRCRGAGPSPVGPPVAAASGRRTADERRAEEDAGDGDGDRAVVPESPEESAVAGRRPGARRRAVASRVGHQTRSHDDRWTPPPHLAVRRRGLRSGWPWRASRGGRPGVGAGVRGRAGRRPMRSAIRSPGGGRSRALGVARGWGMR